ncbi:beta-sarcoglycan [Scaptodrosophila lebanonensis]|uniref:Beta-sarcoglycan n=1 Tax=Drosophila lebanonensis TaxID=7225 RepID=A0A6J2T1B4_DROLE|nr:beta-sarcoglycan [Scaptodrosophila lebanonensis]
MQSFENTFVRGPSPSYSDSSENALSLPIGAVVDFGRSEIGSKADALGCFEEKKSHSFVGEICSHMHPSRQGRNTFAFWTVVVILLVLTVSNLVLTLTIIGVLRLGKGVQGIELIPELDVFKFYGSTDLDRVFTKSFGQIEGFTDIPVTIGGEGGGVHVRVFARNGVPSDRIVLDKDGIVVRATNLFEVKDPDGRLSIFTTHRPQYNMPAGVDVLKAKAVSASRITSPISEPLVLESDGRIAIKGSEGISLDAANALLQAEHHVAINATQGATVLEAGSGIFLDMDRIPIVSSELGLRTGSVQYKICVCMPQGNLFRIAIPRVHNGPKISCAHFSAKEGEDPCAVI